MPPHRPKVLIVEDDLQLAHLYSSALVLRGIDVKRVADGVTALRSSESFRPDVVVLDLMLPVVDGRVVLREFASNPLLSDIPIIVATGEDPVPDLPHAAAVLQKPCDPDHLARIVMEHLPLQSRD